MGKWEEYMEVMTRFGEFIKYMQSNIFLLHEFHVVLSQLVEDLENMISIFSSSFLILLQSIFKSTADGELARLAHLFTPEGLHETRKKMGDLYSKVVIPNI